MDELVHQWKSFISKINENPTIRPITFEAWKRCEDLKIDQANIQFQFLSDNMLKKRQEAHKDLINAAKYHMKLISAAFLNIPHLVSLSDCQGWIIWLEGTPEKFGGKSIGITLGANWSENIIGNNGIGTALATEHPVLIYGLEHYGQMYNSCVCMGIPITNFKGQVIGALDISTLSEYARPEFYSIGLACVNSIEQTISVSSQLNEKISQLEKLLAAGSLLSTTVHDIKNPLTIIRGISQLGELSSNQDKGRKYFRKIIRHVDNLTRMLNEVLGAFQQDNFEIAEPQKLIEEILNEIAPLCKVQQIDIQYKPAKSVWAKIKPELFKRSITNLLENAIQAMPHGGKIIIKNTSSRNNWTISIADTGPGIPIEVQDQIFKPFVKGRKSGLGLGLFMVHYVIKAHNGQIWFETVPGKGTNFFIKLSKTLQTAVNNR